MKSETVKLDSFVRAYVECALWSSTDDQDEPFDANYSIEDVAPEAIEAMIKECADFQELCGGLLDCQSSDQNGHDFWLTRNGHGAGFWDRGLGDTGDKLTDNAHSFGESYLYVGDDGKLYVSP